MHQGGVQSEPAAKSIFKIVLLLQSCGFGTKVSIKPQFANFKRTFEPLKVLGLFFFYIFQFPKIFLMWYFTKHVLKASWNPGGCDSTGTETQSAEAC